MHDGGDLAPILEGTQNKFCRTKFPIDLLRKKSIQRPKISDDSFLVFDGIF